jgi:hypothetical protein
MACLSADHEVVEASKFYKQQRTRWDGCMGQGCRSGSQGDMRRTFYFDLILDLSVTFCDLQASGPLLARRTSELTLVAAVNETSVMEP